MNNQDEEFECSECGATVPFNVELCPNCGALLDGIEKDCDFVEMQVTSNPVDLSIINSLLEKKRIKYSVKESP